MRVADYIFERLVEHGLTTPFVITGRGALFLDDAIAKRDDLNPCFLHHEQSASFAAIAVSEVGESLGCAVVSSGCASTNCMTGVLSAWQDGLPVVFISGQNTLKETTRHTGSGIRTYGQQEADIITLVESITKYAVMIDRPETIRYELEKALHLAHEGRQGPVWIDVPLDIQNMRVDASELEVYFAEPLRHDPTCAEIDLIKNALADAERPVVMLGSGIKRANVTAELAELVETMLLPVVYTSAGADVYGAQHALSIGSVGTMGCSRAGAFSLQNADLVLVLGSRLNSMTTGVDYCKFARNAKIIVVDIDEHEHQKEGIAIDHLIKSDLAALLPRLQEMADSYRFEGWANQCVHWKSVFQDSHQIDHNEEGVDIYQLAAAFSKALAQDGVFICDSGFIDVIMPTNMAFGDGQVCIHPVSQGAMGFTLPAAIGVAQSTKRPVAAVVGDGSIMMNLQELQTISNTASNIKIFVINNNGYAIIRRRQKELFRKRGIGTDPSNGVGCTDFKKIATAFNLTYLRIDDPETLTADCRSVMAMEGPVICEVMGVTDQQYVEVRHAKTESGKFERRPLEDQWPFLDRELFLKEMIVEPIDQ